MRIFDAGSIRRIDRATIAKESIRSFDLMERAAYKCSSFILHTYSGCRNFIVFVGAGNNAGDGLAIARHLINNGKVVRVVDVLPFANKTNDFLENKALIDSMPVEVVYVNLQDIEQLQLFGDEIIVDAIFGIGLNRPVEGLVKEVVAVINNSQNTVISIDVPSGMFADAIQGEGQSIVKATKTLTFQFIKLAFLFAENQKFTGEITILDINLDTEAICAEQSSCFITEKSDVRLKKRLPFDHKGNFGHSLLIAGSYGKIGACILAAKACLRSGTGLLTVHVPEHGVIPLQTAVPESMVSIDSNAKEFSVALEIRNYNAIGVGPGIGTNPNTVTALKELLQTLPQNLVLDADALNIISQHKYLFDLIPHHTIITPHPKEFDRLFGTHVSGHSRFVTQKEMSAKHKIIILLKGHYTSISLPNGEVYFNSTGNPGMATAGCGDVLTGIILGLLAQGYSARDSAIYGAYIHGLAGDIAQSEYGMISLIASDIIDKLPLAMKQLV